MTPPVNGPRSLITTVTVLPFSRSVTVTWVPKGSQGLAAVRPGWWYHEAIPVRVFEEADVELVSGAGLGSGIPTVRILVTGWVRTFFATTSWETR